MPQKHLKNKCKKCDSVGALIKGLCRKHYNSELRKVDYKIKIIT
jgi:hypothetical protein